MYKIKLIALVFIATIGIFWEWIRHPLPKQEGTIKIAGLNELVEVYTDNYGVPHIYAETEQDLFFAAGYIAARDRLFQLSMVSLAVRGGLASVLGPEYLDKDIYFRTWKIHETGKKLVENMNPKNKVIFSTFCDGINYRINEVLHDLPIEFKILRFKPDLWDPAIVAGYTRMMAHEMSGSWKPEVVFGAVDLYFGREMLMDLIPDEDFDIPTIATENQNGLLSSFNKIIESEYSL